MSYCVCWSKKNLNTVFPPPEVLVTDGADERGERSISDTARVHKYA